MHGKGLIARKAHKRKTSTETVCVNLEQLVLTDELSAAVEFLKTAVDDEENIIVKWKQTHLARMEMLKNTELASIDYINRFPCLQGPFAFTLVNITIQK